MTVFPIRSITREGGGNATYLGKYTSHLTAQINVMTRHSTGVATFTAANGDTLTATLDGQATPTTPGMLSVVEVYTITGGTGRFADATGTFTLEHHREPSNGRQYRHVQRSRSTTSSPRRNGAAVRGRRGWV